MHQFFMLPFLKEGRLKSLLGTDIYLYRYLCIYMSILVDLCLKIGTKCSLSLGVVTFTRYEKVS